MHPALEQVDWEQEGEAVVELLRALLRFDTTNPPGNEAECVAFLADTLRGAGVEPEVLSPAPGRANLVARLAGGDGGAGPAAAQRPRRRGRGRGRALAAPAVRRGGPRRRRLGPGRGRHEADGGHERGRRRAAGPPRGAAAARPQAGRGGRRGGRLRRRQRLAGRPPPGQGPGRPRPRGGRRGHLLPGRAALLPGPGGREGHRLAAGHRLGGDRARQHPPRRQRRGPAVGVPGPGRAAQAAHAPLAGGAAVPGGAGRRSRAGPAGPRSRCCSAPGCPSLVLRPRGPRPGAWPACSARCCATRPARRWSTPAARST